MAITRLKRKGRRNKLKAKIRAQKFKIEGFAPVIKNVDIEAIKEEFKKAAKKPATPVKDKKVEAKVAKEEKVEAKASQPVVKAETAIPQKEAKKPATKAKPAAEKKEKAKPLKKAPAATAEKAKKKAPIKAATAAKAKKA